MDRPDAAVLLASIPFLHCRTNFQDAEMFPRLGMKYKYNMV